MKANELRKMTSEELEHELSELKDQLFNLRFQNATVQLENPIKIREVKKTIARVKTILNERNLGINQG
ncbi:MAG: 50S ribosomal protein L29 [Bacillota bacterium]